MKIKERVIVSFSTSLFLLGKQNSKDHKRLNLLYSAYEKEAGRG
jgi:hypothetical protein